MRAASRNALALTFVSALAGCADRSPRAGQADAPVTLTVAAASDLQQALPEVARAFEAREPGVEVRPVFGSSGHLAEQVKAGAGIDLFLSANTKFVDDLAAAGLVDKDSVAPYALGTLVLAVHKEGGGSVGGLNDLTREGVKKVAIANPQTAPYGAAALQALTRAGLIGALRPKLVTAGSVRQALQYVETGNAEAGLVGKATIASPAVRVVEVDPALYDPIVQGLGVVSGSKAKAPARRFAAFLRGPEGQAVLAGFGFRPPPGPDPSAAR